MQEVNDWIHTVKKRVKKLASSASFTTQKDLESLPENKEISPVCTSRFVKWIDEENHSLWPGESYQIAPNKVVTSPHFDKKKHSCAEGYHFTTLDAIVSYGCAQNILPFTDVRLMIVSIEGRLVVGKVAGIFKIRVESFRCLDIIHLLRGLPLFTRLLNPLPETHDKSYEESKRMKSVPLSGPQIMNRHCHACGHALVFSCFSCVSCGCPRFMSLPEDPPELTWFFDREEDDLKEFHQDECYLQWFLHVQTWPSKELLLSDNHHDLVYVLANWMSPWTSFKNWIQCSSLESVQRAHRLCIIRSWWQNACRKKPTWVF